MSQTVLVTGGTGYVGAWCIRLLLERGYDVRATVRDAGKAALVREAIGADGGDAARLSFHTADLMSDAGWDDATAGADYVLHVASPLGGGAPGDRMSLVPPARDGALRVIRAALKAGVKRIVMTSAAAAARPPLDQDRVSDETIWADPDDPQFDAYRVSKILAERAAWEAVKHQPERLTTILPGAVFGPALMKQNLGSLRLVRGLLTGQRKALPRIGFWVVDVRDLADLHVRAMIAGAAAGQRFIAAGEFVWFGDIARMLRAGLGARADKTPRFVLPDLAARTMSRFDPTLRSLMPLLGKRFALTSAKARATLGFAPRPARETIVDSAECLLSFAPSP